MEIWALRPADKGKPPPPITSLRTFFTNRRRFVNDRGSADDIGIGRFNRS
jgi:hypothetical protein